MSFELPQTFFVLLVRVHLQTTGNLYRDNYNECKAGNGLLTEWFQGLEKQAQGFQEWLQKHQNHSPNAPTTVPGSGKRRNTAMSHFLFPFPWAGLFGKGQDSTDGALRMLCRCARPGAPLWWRGACSTGVGMDQSANDHGGQGNGHSSFRKIRKPGGVAREESSHFQTCH